MIYFDNGATTYPKPESVFNNALLALKKYSFNSGRGGYKQSLDAAERIYSVREKIGDMFGFSANNIVFTPNCTLAINMAIKGSVKKGDHIIISSLEHNSVSRSVEALAQAGVVTYDIADYSYDDDITVANFSRLIRPNTRLIVCMHASNVFGVVFPIAQIGEIAKKHRIRFIVDAAQSAGVLPLNAKTDNIDILCAPGHKGLYGPMGIGFMAVGDDIELSTIIEGGTGSKSLSLIQPDFTPDRFESGTLNNLGIIALGAGVDFVNKRGIEKIYAHEMALCKFLYNSLDELKGVSLYTPFPEMKKFAPIVSFNYKDYSSEKVALMLADNNIAVRAGYHCSYLAHKSFGTLSTGTVRVCPSSFNTQKECEKFIYVLKKSP